ncbi:MAG: YceD family protein [Acetobacteraceae bacterium]
MTRDPIPQEFSRPLRLATIPPGGYRIDVAANSVECRALARRFDLPSLATLSCTFALSREPGAVVRASGHLLARVTRICRLTLEQFPADVAEHFVVLFVQSGHESAAFDPETPDEIPYANGVIDLGEATAEQLALALDPWPRKPDVTPHVS